MKGNQAHIVFSLVILILASSCKGTTDRNFQEGEIHYRITYLESNLGKIPVELLPKEMTMKFREGAVMTEIDGIFGYFNISNVTNSKKSDNLTYLKVMNKKFYFEGKPGEVAPGFRLMANMDIEFVDGNKEICGFLCEKALIRLPEIGEDPVPVFFTREIGVKDPNSSTPYHEIDGVLLEFYLTLSNLKMKLIAENIYSKPVTDKKFDRPSDYVRISKPIMESILDSLMVN